MNARDIFWLLGKEMKRTKILLLLIFLQFSFVIVSVSLIFSACRNVTRSGNAYVKKRCMEGNGLRITIQGALYSSLEELSQYGFSYVYPNCMSLGEDFVSEDGTEALGVCHYFESQDGKILTEYEDGCRVDREEQIRVNRRMAEILEINLGDDLKFHCKTKKKVEFCLPVTEIIEDRQDTPTLYISAAALNRGLEKNGNITAPELYGVVKDAKQYFNVRKQLAENGYDASCDFDGVFTALRVLEILLAAFGTLICILGMYSFWNLCDVYLETGTEWLIGMKINGNSSKTLLHIEYLGVLFVIVTAALGAVPICGRLCRGTSDVIFRYFHVQTGGFGIVENILCILIVSGIGLLTAGLCMKHFVKKMSGKSIAERLDFHE